MRHKLTLPGLLALLAFATVPLSGDPPKPNKYIGAEACSSCHKAKVNGDQYANWKGTKHAQAFEVLASDEAKKIAKDRKIDDPQKSGECLKCHQTAFDVPAGDLGPRFDPKQGIQCESCHGAGEKHKSVVVDAPPNLEIVAVPPAETCTGCHNKNSPSYKPFCYKYFASKIRHLNQKKGRTPEELKAMECQGGCGVEHGK